MTNYTHRSAIRKFRAAQKELTAEQLAALRAYADSHGRTWKAQLNFEWMSGTASGPLQQIRNTFGPTWLIRFRLPKENQQ